MSYRRSGLEHELEVAHLRERIRQLWGFGITMAVLWLSTLGVAILESRR